MKGRVVLIAALMSPVMAQSPSSVVSSASEAVVIAATRVPELVAGKPGDVTILTRSQIEARHPSSLVELLRTLPGVIVEQAGGRGSVASIFTRGAKPNFTIVLIDGVKVNDQTNTRGGSADLSTLSLDSIDRIEVARGPRSAIYGSDAMGGVINIITRKGSDRLSVNVDASAGQFGYWRALTEIGVPVDAARVSLGISRTDNGVPVSGSLYRGTAVNGCATGDAFEQGTFEITARFGSSHAESYPDSSGGPSLAIIRDVDRRDINETVFGARFEQQLTRRWAQTLQYSLFNRSSAADSPGVAASRQDPAGIPPNSDDTRYRRDQLTMTQKIIFERHVGLAVGVDFQKESGEDRGSLELGDFRIPTPVDLTRTTGSVFLEARAQLLSALELSTATRYDRTSSAPSHSSPQLGAAYAEQNSGLRFHLSWGRGFKLPSFYSLGNPIVGDPHLMAETSVGVQGSVSKELTAVPGLLEVTGFKTTYTNLIDFNPGPPPRLVNLSRVDAHGGEIAVTLNPTPYLSVNPYASYTISRNEITGSSLRDVPKWLAGANIFLRPITSVMTSISVTHVGSYIDNAIPTGDIVLARHQRVDCSATWQPQPRQKLYVAVENVLNQHYQEAVGFPAPGFFARAGVVITL